MERAIEWVALLDEAPEASPITIEEIETLTNIDDLKSMAFKIESTPLTEFQRSVLKEALWARCRQLGINSWDWTVFDVNRLQQATEAVQDSTVWGTTAVVELLDSTPGKPLRFRFKGSHANVVSLNDRVYLHEIIDPAVERLNTRLAAGKGVFGEDGHPPMDVVDQANPKRKWFRRTPSKAILEPERAFWDGDELMVDARVVEATPAGKQLAQDLRAKLPVHFSTRAYGGDQRVVQLADGRKVAVPLAMEIEVWDRVDSPAIPDAEPRGLLDSVQVQAILDSVQGKAPAPAPAPAANITHKGDSAVKWTKALIDALKGSKEGRAQILTALTDGTLTLEAEIRTAMTDALADPAQAPAAAPSQDAIALAVNKALTDAAEQARVQAQTAAQARTDAATFVKEQLGTLRAAGKYPAAMLDSVATALADMPDKATAEAKLKDQIALVDSILPTLHLSRLGYAGGANGAQLNIEVGENQAWKGIYDGLMQELDGYRANLPGETMPDLELRKANKPFVDKLLRQFDSIKGKAMIDAMTAWNTLTDSTSITTADLWTQAVVQRAIIEQVFGDADMLQFLGTDVFDGVTMTQPVEYYESSGSPGHHTGELQPMARGKVRTAWIPFTALPRRIATEISNDAQKALSGGPLNYNAAARALYHTMAEIRRHINIEGGNEMLRASDAYAAVNVAAETAAVGEIAAVNDAGNAKYKITLRRGAGTGALGTAADAPVVRPRAYTSFDVRGQSSSVVENAITVKVNNVVLTPRSLIIDDAGVAHIVDDEGVHQEGFAVDFEYGQVYVSEAYTVTVGSSDFVAGYSYATNFSTFSLTVPPGTKRAEHYSELIHGVDDAKALMARYPRYREPNFALGTISAMNPVMQSDLFYVRNSPSGTVLSNTKNFIASRNDMDFAKHNTRWQAGDRRILLGSKGATKYAVRDLLQQKGPYPMYDGNGRILPGEQWYVEGFDAMVTPEIKDQTGKTLNPYYHTVILK